MLPAGSTDQQLARQDHPRARNRDSRGPLVAKQAVAVEIARSSDRQADLPRTVGRPPLNNKAKHVFRFPTPETSYLADIRIALEDCEAQDSAGSLMIAGLSKHSNWKA